MQPESSFNTDGRFPTFDLMQPYGGIANRSEAWLAPQPGGSGAGEQRYFIHVFRPMWTMKFLSTNPVY